MAYGLLLFHLCVALAGASSLADESWQEAVASYQKGDFAHAAQQFEAWSDAHQHRSPQALYNASLSEWNQKDYGPAMFHLLQSTRLESAPWRTFRNLKTASQLEKKIGIKDGLSDRLPFQLSFLVSPNCAGILGSMAVWLFALLALFWKRGKTSPNLKAARLPVALLGVALIAVAFLSYSVQTFFSPYGVVVSKETGTSLVRAPNEKAPEKLVDLPSGTLVSVRDSQGKYTEITAPLAGWVDTSAIQLLFK